jgi:hypothetical protein
VIATLETREVPFAFTTVGHGAWLQWLLRQLLPARDARPAALSIAQAGERIGYQCRVIAALAAADRDTQAAEAVLRRLERKLACLRTDPAACIAG